MKDSQAQAVPTEYKGLQIIQKEVYNQQKGTFNLPLLTFKCNFNSIYDLSKFMDIKIEKGTSPCLKVLQSIQKGVNHSRLKDILSIVAVNAPELELMLQLTHNNIEV